MSRRKSLSIVPQREDLPDCWLATLATYLEKRYETVLVASVKVQPKALSTGLSTENILKVAKRLRRPLTPLSPSQYVLEEDSGILEVIGINHVVVLWEGIIVDDKTVWRRPNDYFTHHLARPGKLLVKA